MGDELSWRNRQTSRRRLLRTVSGLTAVGVASIPSNTAATGSNENSRLLRGNPSHRDDWEDISQSTMGVEGEINNSQERTFGVEPINPTVEAGSSTLLDIQITNNSPELLQNIEGKFFSDDPLDSSDDEFLITQLEPNETTTVTVDLSASEGATSQSYSASIDFRYTDTDGESNLSDTYPIDISVTVSETGVDESSSFELPENNSITVLLGVAGIIGAGVYAWRQSHRSIGSILLRKPSNTDTDVEPQSAIDSRGQDETVDVGELQERASVGIKTAETAEAAGEYQQAVESYKEAITHIEQALAKVDDDTYEQEIQVELQETQAAFDTLTAYRKQRDSIATTLQTAERSLQEAIVQYAAGSQTVARIRFRQARNAFEDARKAIDDCDDDVLASPIEISSEKVTPLPSTALEDLALLEDTTLEALSEAGIETITELEADTGTVIPTVIAKLAEYNEISEEESTLLTFLSWWYEGDRHEITNEAVVSSRWERADFGVKKST